MAEVRQGNHSGDATVVLPPQKLYLETIRRTKRIARKIVKALHILIMSLLYLLSLLKIALFLPGKMD